MNDAAYAAAKDANLSTCDNCKRRMLPVQLVRHQKACRPGVNTFKRTKSARAHRPKFKRVVIIKKPPSHIPGPLGRAIPIQSTIRPPRGGTRPGNPMGSPVPVPTVSVPTVSVSTFSVPTVSIPTFSVPTVSARNLASTSRSVILAPPTGLRRPAPSRLGPSGPSAKPSTTGRPGPPAPPSVRVQPPSPVTLSPVSSSSSSPSPPSSSSSSAVSTSKTASFSRPPTRVCYVCGREFGSTSIAIHEPQCLEKWRLENARQPAQLRRSQPVKPQTVQGDGIRLTRDQINEVAYETFKSNLSLCARCSRRFLPDRLIVHQRSCKA
ncbi:putative Zinc finger protein 474 [Hypsibius exemplaris]|uniref:Zinc finger protein 474 n=1 Tax=Hypsibius exemplaris TaxID=2072580 RepID=A0A9X6NDN3_HYPEX|nr:putative Zinc finger protein 474 [Hypsibius exemplaris]